MKAVRGIGCRSLAPWTIVIGVAALCLCGAPQPADAQARAFLEISGVAGDSSDSGHRDWITIVSFQHSISGAPTPMTAGQGGGTGDRGRASAQDFSIIKNLDKSSPSMLRACAKGSHLREVTLRVQDAGGAGYLVYTLERVTVTGSERLQPGEPALDGYPGLSSGAHGGGLTKVTFRCARVTWEFEASGPTPLSPWRRTPRPR